MAIGCTEEGKGGRGGEGETHRQITESMMYF